MVSPVYDKNKILITIKSKAYHWGSLLPHLHTFNTFSNNCFNLLLLPVILEAILSVHWTQSMASCLTLIEGSVHLGTNLASITHSVGKSLIPWNTNAIFYLKIAKVCDLYGIPICSLKNKVDMTVIFISNFDSCSKYQNIYYMYIKLTLVYHGLVDQRDLKFWESSSMDN